MTTTTPSPNRSNVVAPGATRGPCGVVAPAVPPELRAALLEIARVALRVAVGAVPAEALAARLSWLPESDLRAAVFVTLLEDGDLRGCMGTLDPGEPVLRAVASAALTAAIADPRFCPLEADELGGLWVDVSVLGAVVALADPAEFVPGVDGIIVERGPRRALLLPEVATHHGWDGERMLAAVCEKAGLPADAWRDSATRCLVFRTVRVGGRALEGRPVA